MSGYELWTEVAIWVLVLGAPLVFAWFLKDAARLVRGLGRGAGPGEGRDPAGGAGPGEGAGDGKPGEDGPSGAGGP